MERRLGIESGSQSKIVQTKEIKVQPIDVTSQQSLFTFAQVSYLTLSNLGFTERNLEKVALSNETSNIN